MYMANEQKHQSANVKKGGEKWTRKKHIEPTTEKSVNVHECVILFSPPKKTRTLGNFRVGRDDQKRNKKCMKNMK